MVEHAATLDSVFSALADPTRRAILHSLKYRSATINEIAEPFPVSLNAISKHVMVLERAGLLRREVRGRQHHCRIDPAPLQEAEEWLEQYREFWEQRLHALTNYVSRTYKPRKKRPGHGKVQ
jgi:DNA-binding transcriptional ArsR family regulator